MLFSYPLSGNPVAASDLQGGLFEFTPDGYLRYVLAVVHDELGRVFMLKNKKFDGRYQFPGGKIDAGENARDALRREIAEELGVSVEFEGALGERKVYAGGTLWQGEYFSVRFSGTPAICEPHKHEHAAWVRVIPVSSPPGFLAEVHPLNGAPSLIVDDAAQLDQTYDLIALRAIRRGETTARGLELVSTRGDLAGLPATVFHIEYGDGSRAFADEDALRQISAGEEACRVLEEVQTGSSALAMGGKTHECMA